MIHVIATVVAAEGNRAALLSAFEEILPAVRRKAGCVEYRLAIHFASGLPGQAAFDENELIIVEQWLDMDALKTHIGDQAYQAWFVGIRGLMSGASMQIFEGVS